MNIAILADEGKKELLIQFCLNYCSILSKNNLIAEETIAQLITKSTGLQIDTVMSNGPECTQQILSRIAYKEIDMLLFFKNPMDTQNNLNNDEIFRTCNTYNILFAPNLATAEALVSSLACDKNNFKKETNSNNNNNNSSEETKNDDE